MPLLVFAGPAAAVRPANIQAGPVFITPTLDTRLGYDDNLLRSKDDKKDTGFSIVTPRVQGWLQNGLNTYSLTGALVNNVYFDSSKDDITDEQYNLDLHQVFTPRHTVDVYSEYWDFHEARGTGLSEGIGELLDGPVKLDRTTVGLDYFYGTRSSRGRLEFSARTVDHEYKNYPTLTRFHDRTLDRYSGAFLWQVAPRTDAVFELRYLDTRYDHTRPAIVGAELDSDELNYLAGVTWEATANTTGSAKVGMIDRDYDAAGEDDDRVFSWEVDATWYLRTYSRFNLATNRQFNETNGQGNAVDTQRYALSWDHDWSGQSSTRMVAGYGDEDYTDSGRQDDRYDLEAQYKYAFRRWLDITVAYRYEKLDSDQPRYDFNRNVVYLQADFSL